MFTIVSWYTCNTIYEQIIQEYLLASLHTWDIDQKIYPIESQKNWQINTNLKPLILEQALKDIPNDIVLLDADCKLLEYPDLFNTIPDEYDMAVFYLDWQQWYNKAYNKEELCSGTLFFRNRPICLEVIEAWKNLCKKNLYPDQMNLEVVLNTFPGLKIYRLPIEYCWIHTLPDGSEPRVPRPEHVVIEHYQASRTIKKGGL